MLLVDSGIPWRDNKVEGVIAGEMQTNTTEGILRNPCLLDLNEYKK